MKNEVAQHIVEENRRIYNVIAEQFSSTRSSPWPEFSLFEAYVRSTDALLDIGCGNGRIAQYFKPKGVRYTGLDNSSALVERARTANLHGTFVVGEATRLPFKSESFDVILCVATLHHIPSNELRQQAVNEAFRTAKHGAYFLLTEWNLWSMRWWQTLLAFSWKKACRRSSLDWGDVRKPWKNSHGIVMGERYLHLFTLRGLTCLLRNAGFQVIEHRFTSRTGTATRLTARNIFTVAQKP
ncbi:MAG: class I SAM-dependent methyltransferase [Patescibacteria group bacterium]|nr:class I SAM-dependent methyltransferase [Patescibacteria group bacterium]MDD5715833.1 class I SAM-dependent methyltransferase [Patescibacteria group bacterium]